MSQRHRRYARILSRQQRNRVSIKNPQIHCGPSLHSNASISACCWSICRRHSWTASQNALSSGSLGSMQLPAKSASGFPLARSRCKSSANSSGVSFGNAGVVIVAGMAAPSRFLFTAVKIGRYRRTKLEEDCRSRSQSKQPVPQRDVNVTASIRFRGDASIITTSRRSMEEFRCSGRESRQRGSNR